MFRIVNRGKYHEVLIYDEIGGGIFGGVSAEEIVSGIQEAKPNDIHARINSAGGDVFEGFAIYEFLKQHPARVDVSIDGLAASAASLIAMAGDQVSIGDSAMMMIHNAWTITAGDANELERVASLLHKINGNLRDAYVEKTGQPPERIEAMMSAETWMDASEACDLGFCDATSNDMLAAAASVSISTKWGYHNVPKHLPTKEPEAWKTQADDRLQRLPALSS